MGMVWLGLKYFTLALAAFIVVYVACALGLSRISVNNDFTSIPPDQAGNDIYVRTNGVHTDIILPIKTAVRDWSSIIPQADVRNLDAQFSYMSFGWGDKGFYLDTPTWADLKASTAFIAATGLGSTSMHVEAVAQPKTTDTVRHLRISDAALQSIVNDVDKSFKRDTKNQIEKINTAANYNEHDVFYEANGRYSVFKTCNEWTRQTLSNAKIKTSAFSPLPDGVLRFLP